MHFSFLNRSTFGFFWWHLFLFIFVVNFFLWVALKRIWIRLALSIPYMTPSTVCFSFRGMSWGPLFGRFWGVILPLFILSDRSCHTSLRIQISSLYLGAIKLHYKSHEVWRLSAFCFLNNFYSNTLIAKKERTKEQLNIKLKINRIIFMTCWHIFQRLYQKNCYQERNRLKECESGS